MTKVAGERSQESAELRAAEVGVCVCLAGAGKNVYKNKTNDRKIPEWMGRKKSLIKQRVSLTKS